MLEFKNTALSKFNWYSKKNPKLLYAPMNNAGVSVTTMKHLRREGFDAHHIQYTFGGNNVFNYETDHLLNLNEYGGRINGQLYVLEKCLEYGFDIYHFWSRSLFYKTDYSQFSAIDYPIIKARGARIIHRFTGYDVRLPSLDKELNPYSGYRYGYEPAASEDLMKAGIEFMRTHADRLLVQDPELQQHCPDAAIIPRALELDRWPYVGLQGGPNDIPIVVHAPSSQVYKGTKFVLKAVEELQQEGVQFEFKLVHGVPNDEAKEIYKGCDILIDGLIVGTTGVCTLEGWALGKAVVNYTPHHLFAPFYGVSELPVVDANPDTIKDQLKKIIKDYEWRKQIATNGRKLVEEFHDVEKVVKQFSKLYRELLKKPTKTPVDTNDLKYLELQSKIDQAHLRTANQLKQKLEETPLTSHGEAVILPNDARFLRQNTDINRKILKEMRSYAAISDFGAAVDSKADKNYDAIIFHDLFSVIGVDHLLKLAKNGTIFLDCVESPFFDQRAGKAIRNMDSLSKYLCDINVKSFSNRIDYLLTVSDALIPSCERYFNYKNENYKNEHVSVVKNFRKIDEFVSHSAPNDKPFTLAFVNTIAENYGVENILKAISLRNDINLEFLGRFSTEAYKETIQGMILELGLSDRVAVSGEIYGENLINSIAQCHIGICTFDLEYENFHAGLPNRVGDYIAAGVPIIATSIKDVADIILPNSMGVVINDGEPQTILGAIEEIEKSYNKYRENVLANRENFHWDTEFETVRSQIREAKGRFNRVAIVARKSVATNSRIARMVNDLIEDGFRVDVYARSQNKLLKNNGQIRQIIVE